MGADVKLTKKQRAKVVELLRSAADDCPWGGLNGMFRAEDVGASVCVVDAAWCARDLAADLRRLRKGVEPYRHVLLEAALRVEQGEWP